MGRPGKLTPNQVIEIREKYEHQRDLADNDPEYAETVATTEDRLAEHYGVSSSMIRRIVLGLSYARVGGPIDETRRAAAKEVLDAAPPPRSVRLTITRPGMSPQTFVYPPGTAVTVVPVSEDPDNYTTTGKPKEAASTPRKTAPKAKTTRKVRPRRSHSTTAPEEYQPDSAAPSSGFAAQMLRGE